MKFAFILLVLSVSAMAEFGGPDRSARPGYQPGLFDRSPQPGYQGGYDASPQPGYQPSNNPGYQPDYQPGYQPGYDTSPQPGYQPGYNPGHDMSPRPGYQAGFPSASGLFGGAPGVYRSQHNQGGGNCGPNGCGGWNRHGATTVVVPPPPMYYPRPYCQPWVQQPPCHGHGYGYGPTNHYPAPYRPRMRCGVVVGY